MERKARSAVEMALEMKDEKEGNKLYDQSKKQKNQQYPEAAAEIRTEAIQTSISNQLDILQKSYVRGRVDLNDTDAVHAQAMEYMRACQLAGVFPTMLGFSSALGVSRQYLYAYIQRNREAPTSEYLDRLRSSWAGIIAQASLIKAADNATSIFLLKNSGQGLTDKVEVEAVKKEQPLGEMLTLEEIASRYRDMVDD